MKKLKQFVRFVTLAAIALVNIIAPLIQAWPVKAIDESLWVNSSQPTVLIEPAAFKSYRPTNSLCEMFTFQALVSINNVEQIQSVQECAVRTQFGVIGDNYLLLNNTSIAMKYVIRLGFSISASTPNAKNLVYSLGTSKKLFSYRDPASKFTKQVGFRPSGSIVGWPYIYQATADPDWSLVNQSGQLLDTRTSATSKNGQWMVVHTAVGLLRINLETFEFLNFTNQLPSFGTTASPIINLAISNDGRYVAVGGETIDGLRIHDLSTCTVPSIPNSTTLATGCSQRDMNSAIQTQLPSFIKALNLEFNSDGTQLNMQARIGSNQYQNVTLTAYGQAVSQLDYLALGDSFSSGEGAFEYLPGTDGDGPAQSDIDTTSEKCHIAASSYPFLVASSTGVGASEFKSIPCSGSMQIDMLNTTGTYKGQQGRMGGLNGASLESVKALALQNFTPGRAAQIEFVEKYKPRAITLTMGGNDVGFAAKIQDCVMSATTCSYASDPTTRRGTFQQIKGQFNRLIDLYQNLHNVSDKTKIYVIGYPKFFGGNQNCEINAGFIDPVEQEFVNQSVTYMNDVIEAAAKKVGVYYIDIENSLQDHGLCSTNPAKAFNGIMPGNDLYFSFFGIGNESYHPNTLGHQLMAQIIAGATGNPVTFNPCPGSIAVICPDLEISEPALPSYASNAPAPEYAPLFIQLTNSPTLATTATGILPLDLLLEGLTPGTLVTFELHSNPLPLATAQVDGVGKINATLHLPVSTPAGLHTIHAFTTVQSGEKIDFYQPVLVLGPDGDRDADGVPDTADPCSFMPASNTDTDHDGIDDACDPNITDPPTDSTPPTVSGTATRQPNNSGWYDDDVDITWTATDPEPSSGTPTTPPTTTASLEGENTYSSKPACDPQGNCASGSLTIRLDKTEPGITYSLSQPPNVLGWHNSAVTITFECSDSLSGIESCSPPVTLNDEGSHEVTGLAQDNAGNVNNIEALVNIDTTNPGLTNVTSPQPDLSGWYKTDVTVTPLCSDELSGIESCSQPSTITTEGKDQNITNTAIDKAGNNAQLISTVSVDKTAPTLGTSFWTNNPKPTTSTATLNLTISDNLSGIAAAEYFLGDSDPGQGNGAPMVVGDNLISAAFGTDFPTGVFKVTVRAKDVAGNWSGNINDYLVVYSPDGIHVTGKRVLVPSAARGDILPGLANNTLADKATFGFNVRYDQQGLIHKNSDFQFDFKTGENCKIPNRATNCHSLELNAVSITWLTTQGQNNNTGIFQGMGQLVVDGQPSTVIFRLVGVDGERLSPTSQDYLTLKIFREADNPNTSPPIYQASGEVTRGNIKIRTD